MTRAVGLLLGLVGAALLHVRTAHAVTVHTQASAPAQVGAEVTFAVTASGQGQLMYTWSFGDGGSSGPSPQPTATHTYATPGHHPVIVSVRDASSVRSASFLQIVHYPTTATPARASSSIVCDATGARVYHVNPDQGTITSIDAETLTRRWEQRVGPTPRTLAFAPDGTLWVVTQDSSSITVVDAESGARLANIVLPYASRPYGLAFSPDGTAAYVTLQATGELAVLDPVGRTLVQRVPAGKLPTGLAVSADGARILVTRFISPDGGGEVTEIDGPTLALTRVHTLAVDQGSDGEDRARGVPNYLVSVAISPDGRRAWIPSKKDNLLRGGVRDGQPLSFETSVRAIVSQLDLEAGGGELPAARVDLNNRSLPMSVAFSPLGDLVFVALEGSNHVEVLDAYSGKIVAGARDVGHAPLGLVLTPGGRLFVHAFISRTVEVYDARGLLSARDFVLPRLGAVASVASERLAPDVLMGKRIFYDAADLRMARDGYLACAACHLDGFEDGRVWDFTDRGEGLRNTTSLLGRRGTGMGPLHWSANFDEVQDFEHDIRNAFGGKGFLPDAVFHSGTRDTTLGDGKAGLSPELDALAAYVTSLNHVHPSPFRAPGGALTPDGAAGQLIFAQLGCPSCHAGPDFTDSFAGVRHDVGTIKPTSGHRLGGELTLDTPTLLGAWETAPYLHDGSAPSLRDVLTSANPDDRHGVTSTLDAGELDQLVAYLLQLDSGPAPAPEPIAPLAGEPDAGHPDARAATGTADEPGAGCGCSVGRPARPAALALLLVLLALASLVLRCTRCASPGGSCSRP